MNNIREEILELDYGIRNLYAKSSEIKANLSIKYLKHKLNEYLKDYKMAT